MTFWIREVADNEICPRVPFGTHSTRSTEALGFTKCGLDVWNADVKHHVTAELGPPPTPPGIPVPSLVVLRLTNP